MKLGASYNLFDGEELLEDSIKSIRNNVDYINVVFQKTSNLGHACSAESEEVIKDLLRKKLIDELIIFSPDLQKPPRANEFHKRQIGYEFARNKGCTHFLTMDTDEFYDEKQFADAKELIEKEKFNGSACDTVGYFKLPIYQQMEFPERYYVSFIFETSPYRNMEYNCPLPVLVDPTRRIPSDRFYTFEKNELIMHHMSLVRKNIMPKIINSSAIGQYDKSIDDYIRYFNQWDVTQPGYHILETEEKRSKTANIIEVPNKFNIDLEKFKAPQKISVDGKLIFICHEASRTGAPILLLHMLQWIKNNTDIEFEVILKRGGDLTEDFQKIAWCHTIEKMTREEILLLITRYGRENISLIYSNTVSNGQLQEFLGQLKKPQICHIHELNYAITCDGGDQNLGLVNKYSRKIIACSQAVKNNLVKKRNIPAEKIVVVHEFIKTLDLSKYNEDLKKKVKAELNIPEDALVVGAVAQIQWRKGTDLFVNACKLINKKFGNKVHFIWLGGYVYQHERPHYEHDIEKAGLKEVFHHIDHCANPFDYMNTFDVYVMPSKEDPFPLANLEAASLQKPVVCFEDGGGTPELVENDAGFVVPYLDVEEMANKIIELLENPGLREQMGKTGAQKVQTLYNVDVITPKVLQIILSNIY